MPDSGKFFRLSGLRFHQSGLQRRPDLLDLQVLDHIALLVTIEAFEPDAALKTGAHVVRIVLESAQRADLALEQCFLSAADPRRGVPGDPALGDETAGDKPLRDGKSCRTSAAPSLTSRRSGSRRSAIISRTLSPNS